MARRQGPAETDEIEETALSRAGIPFHDDERVVLS